MPAEQIHPQDSKISPLFGGVHSKKLFSDDGGGGDMDDLHARVRKLEVDVSDLRITLARVDARTEELPRRHDIIEAKNNVIESILNCKTDFMKDLSGTKTSLIGWFIATQLTVIGIVIAIASLK